MKLNLQGIKDKEAWNAAGIQLPGYDVEAAVTLAKEAPVWVHFGIGNIFRIFIGGIADGLLEQGELDRGLTCVETFDYDVVDRIYDPYDNMALSVLLHGDGTRECKVLGSLAEAVKGDCKNAAQWQRLKEIFTSDSLQMVSFTITEKGYALRDGAGSWLSYVKNDIDQGPEMATGAMGIVTAMLYERWKKGMLSTSASGIRSAADSAIPETKQNAGPRPIALVSMDNCSHNGANLRESIMTMAVEWQAAGFVPAEFVAYVSDEDQVAFPWTMIDKITPRPGEQICHDLEALGVENMAPVITGKRTYIAPYVNAEKPQYLVIEDHFPNGRPALEKGFGVYMADRNTVNLSERMKVTACLNPVHSATGPLGVVLGYDLYADMLHEDPTVMKMARKVAYDESLPMITSPGIIDPQDFLQELFEDRFVNRFLGDTNLRLSTDVSQGVGVRFGETIKAYVKKQGTAESLVAIPLGIAGWLRYMMAVDDAGQKYELAPDPMNEEISELLSTVKLGSPESLTDQLRPILSNERVFFIDLYQAGLGEKIEGMFREMIAGPGSCRATVQKWIG